MRKPKKIRIGGVDFRIKYYRKMPPSIKRDLGDGCAGYCDSLNKELGLLTKYAQKDPSLLFHEIVHACADMVRANNPLGNESFARPFVQILYGALKEAGYIK